MTGIKQMCPNAPTEYFKGCGGHIESISSMARRIRIGHTLYGFSGMITLLLTRSFNRDVSTWRKLQLDHSKEVVVTPTPSLLTGSKTCGITAR